MDSSASAELSGFSCPWESCPSPPTGALLFQTAAPESVKGGSESILPTTLPVVWVQSVGAESQTWIGPPKLVDDLDFHAGALAHKNIRVCLSKSDLRLDATYASATGRVRLSWRPLCHLSQIGVDTGWETQYGDLAEEIWAGKFCGTL